MLQSHTERSLCLIDEFGKGTSPIDGIALLATTIKHFVKKKAKVLCVLHFTEVFDEHIFDMGQCFQHPSSKINDHYGTLLTCSTIMPRSAVLLKLTHQC